MNKDQFNTMSEVFSDQFKEFKSEITEQMNRKSIADTAQSSIFQNLSPDPSSAQAPSSVEADAEKIKQQVLGSKDLEDYFGDMMKTNEDKIYKMTFQYVDNKIFNTVNE